MEKLGRLSDMINMFCGSGPTEALAERMGMHHDMDHHRMLAGHSDHDDHDGHDDHDDHDHDDHEHDMDHEDSGDHEKIKD